MTDTTLDALLEAVQLLLEAVMELPDCIDPEWGKIRDAATKIDALIAQRKGRPDDQPATVSKRGFDLKSMEPDELRELGNAIDLELTRRDVCIHGVQLGERCPQCKAEYAAAIVENG